MNGKGFLVVGVILMCFGFGGVIYEVTSEAPAQPPSTVVAPSVELVAPPLLPALPLPVLPPPILPAPTMTTEEQVYLETMLEHSDIVADTVFAVGFLLENPQYFDDDWRLKVAVQISIMKLLYEEAKVIEPPSSLSNFHSKYVEAMYHSNKSCDFLVQGIDELDPDLIDEAGEEMEIATQLMEEAAQLMTEFAESRT